MSSSCSEDDVVKQVEPDFIWDVKSELALFQVDINKSTSQDIIYFGETIKGRILHHLVKFMRTSIFWLAHLDLKRGMHMVWVK